MPEAKNLKTAADVATTPVAEAPAFEYVTIPERDMFDYPHPGVAINRDHFGPGTHKLPLDIAREVKERLAKFEAQNIRILQPRKDLRALEAIARNRGSNAVDMTPDNSKQV
jgi:hypothetical protein